MEAQSAPVQKTKSGTEIDSSSIEKPSLVAGCTWPRLRRSHRYSGTNSSRPRKNTNVKPAVVGGATGSRPIDGPATTSMAALSIERLCHCFLAMLPPVPDHHGVRNDHGQWDNRPGQRICERRLVGAADLPDGNKVHHGY